MAAAGGEAADGAHGRTGQGIAVGFLGQWEVASEARGGRLGDRRERAGDGLGSADADLAWRHDQYRCLERLDRIELLPDEARVVLRVLERTGLSARVLLARDERDLDGVAVGR